MCCRNSYVRRLIRHYGKTHAALGRSYLCGVQTRDGRPETAAGWSCTLHITPVAVRSGDSCACVTCVSETEGRERCAADRRERGRHQSTTAKREDFARDVVEASTLHVDVGGPGVG